MSDAISAQGTELSVDFGASPTSFVPIPEVRSIGGPNETSDETEVTHLGSTGGRREYIQGFKDADDCPVEMNYVPGDSVQQQLLDLYDSGDVVRARETYPDGSKAEYDFFVKGRSRPVSVGDAIVITATLRITGSVTFTPSA